MAMVLQVPEGDTLMSDAQPPVRLRGLLHEIWLYLQANPRGKDTVEGIQEWWIANGRQRFSKDDVQSALDLIVARGWMQQSSVGSTVLYSTSATALEEFSRAVNELK
jgi:hypothetical protein